MTTDEIFKHLSTYVILIPVFKFCFKTETRN
jgi:hypothetical protein